MYVFVLRVYAQDFYCNAPLVSYCKRGTTKLMITITDPTILPSRPLWSMDHHLKTTSLLVDKSCSRIHVLR